ncbi:MAG: phosphoribosyl-AMP cyclohydrolase [Rhodospirillales bacterium]|nr:phosphoribosyl-AMP cyclohydrolase [Alphaproteobacteria bacterium]MCB9980806.1 phosphoribosyl-AMP cyclohydrolase [Rhodospirillales bacterium]
MSNKKQNEETLTFTPRFDEYGLIPCITTSAKTGKVLMMAWMNDEAICKSIETGEAHYWSRSRQKLWHKGENSGNTQKIIHMRTDCDQDCLWISVEMNPEASCHTGRKSCFYREINLQADPKLGQMKFIDANRLFDPKKVY